MLVEERGKRGVRPQGLQQGYHGAQAVPAAACRVQDAAGCGLASAWRWPSGGMRLGRQWKWLREQQCEVAVMKAIRGQRRWGGAAAHAAVSGGVTRPALREKLVQTISRCKASVAGACRPGCRERVAVTRGNCDGQQLRCQRAMSTHQRPQAYQAPARATALSPPPPTSLPPPPGLRPLPAARRHRDAAAQGHRGR